MNRRAQLICAWCGPATAILFAIGAALLARFIPAHVRPHLSAGHHYVRQDRAVPPVSRSGPALADATR